MAFEENWANDYQSTIAGGGFLAAALSCVVASAAGAPATPFRFKVVTAGGAIEYIMVKTVAGTTFSWTSGADRGLEGGTAIDHAAGEVCGAPLTAGGLANGLVRQLLAGTNTSLSPAGGQGTVTVSLPNPLPTQQTGNFRNTIPYRARARNNANQSLSDNVEAKVALQAEDYDDNANFDNVTNYRYTAPVTAKYLFAFGVIVSPGAQTALVHGYLKKNGTEVAATRSTVHIAANSQRAGVTGTHILALAASDYIEVWALADGSVAGSTLVGDGTGDAFLSVHYMSE